MSLGKKLRKIGDSVRYPRSSQLSFSGKGSDPYLSYHDILLTNEDMVVLENDWLTDNNISFWEEYLEREYLPKYPQAKIILLRPTIAYLLCKEKDIDLLRSALPNFDGVTHIFLPINDQRNVLAAESGSHWSLLLVSIIDHAAFHYDSLGGSNREDAKETTYQLERVLQTRIFFHHMDDCPQQENMKDCGVFVCILMRHLLMKRLLQANSSQKVSMSMANKMIDSIGGRTEMKNILKGMRRTALERQQYVALKPVDAIAQKLTIAALGGGTENAENETANPENLARNHVPEFHSGKMGLYGVNRANSKNIEFASPSTSQHPTLPLPKSSPNLPASNACSQQQASTASPRKRSHPSDPDPDPDPNPLPSPETPSRKKKKRCPQIPLQPQAPSMGSLIPAPTLASTSSSTLVSHQSPGIASDSEPPPHSVTTTEFQSLREKTSSSSVSLVPSM